MLFVFLNVTISWRQGYANIINGLAMKNNRKGAKINNSSMADIAFLLLIFFLVTTTIVNDKGVMLLLPPKKTDKPPIVPIRERNLFKILVNSENQLLVNNELSTDLNVVRSSIMTFVLNNGRDKTSSESPQKAVVSIKTNRGTSYEKYIEVLNIVQGAYYDIYSENANLIKEAYLALKISDPKERAIIIKAKNGIPMNISIAEPSY